MRSVVVVTWLLVGSIAQSAGGPALAAIPTPSPSPTATATDQAGQGGATTGTQDDGTGGAAGVSPDSETEDGETGDSEVEDGEIEDGAAGEGAEPSPTAPRTPRPEQTIPATRPQRAPTGATACARGEYGEVLGDGTVDVACDGVLSQAEQRFPLVLRLEESARPEEGVVLVIEESDVAGRVLRTDPVSARGGTVRRFPLLYEAPEGLEGRDQFSLWTLLDGYQREVRVLVDVERSTGAAAAGPPRGVLVRASEAAVATSGIAAFEAATSGWIGWALVVVLGLGLLGSAWGAARRLGWRVPDPSPPPPDGPSPTRFTAGG